MFQLSKYNTVADLKAAYRKLAMANHPDRGGDTESMKALNNEYQDCLKALDGTQDDKYTYRYNDKDEVELMAKIYELLSLNMVDVTINLIGKWIWITGDTKAHKDGLKELKCRWHGKRKCWYWKDFSKKSRYNKKGSLKNLADKYGCVNSFGTNQLV